MWKSIPKYNDPMADRTQNNDEPNKDGARAGQFDSTHWSLVLAVGSADSTASQSALAQLCEDYWQPLYAYALRKVRDPHQAQDITQGFFVQLLQRNMLEVASPERGRFRSFLLTSLQNFIKNQWRAGQALKRGGGRLPLRLDFESAGEIVVSSQREETPEETFDREWAHAVLRVVLKRLHDSWSANGKSLEFQVLRQFLTGRTSETTYSDAARELGMTAGAVKTAASRLRTQYRQVLRTEIAQTVQHPGEVEDEIRRLFQVLSRK